MRKLSTLIHTVIGVLKGIETLAKLRLIQKRTFVKEENMKILQIWLMRF